MSFNDQEVNLTIQGKDLFSAEAKKSEQALQELGRESERLNEQLDDLKQQQEAIRAIDELTTAISRNEQAFSDNSVALDQLKREQKQAATEVKNLETAQREAAASTAKVEAEYQQTAAQLAQYDSQVAATRAEVERLSATQGKGAQATQAQAQALSKAKADLQQLETTQRSTAASAEKLSNELEQERRGLNQLNTAVDEASRKKADYALKVKTASSDLTQLGTSISRNKQELGKQQAVLQKAGVDMSKLAYASKELKEKQTQAETALKGVNDKLVLHNSLLGKNKAAAAAANLQTALTTQAVQTLAKAYAALLSAQQAVAAVKTGVENYGELEAAITKVEKTTGNAREEVVKMAAELKELGEKVTPTSTSELLRMAEVAGQLGTKSTEDILNLVAAADALGLSTNLAGDEAATMLARILGMTREGIPQIQNLSSSVVALGNDFAVTEADIVQMTKELVSGTREINLGSAAAAALGATLAELGQPAERSRTAIQQLGAEINNASKKGGDSLESLSKITGLTAKQIEQDLGEAPEKVLVKFLEGLQRVKAEGGLVSDALKAMGITGTEATGVLTVLADGTDRLKVALNLANQAYEAGDYHMKEAAKAYADQESAIGRLENKFHNLSSEIGQAFSDETDAAIRAAGAALDAVDQDAVALMEHLPEIGQGFIDLLGDVDNFATGTSNAFETLDLSLGLFASGLNAVQVIVNSMTLKLSELDVKQKTLLAIASKLAGIEYVTAKQVNDAKQRSEEIRNSITRDLNDITTQTKRMNGESSIAYEGLVKTAAKYRGSIEQLSIAQRNQLNDILLSGKYNADLNKTYRELTAALVRANRESEIEAELKNKVSEASKKKAEADAKAAEGSAALVALQKSINAENADYATILARVTDQQSTLNEMYSQGKLSADEFKIATAAIANSIKAYADEVDSSNKAQKSQTELTAEFLAKRKELQAQYEKGLITEKELSYAQQDLARAYDKSVASANASVGTAEVLSDAQLALQEKILTTEKAIRELQKAVEDENKSSSELAITKAKLAKEEANLADLKRQAAELAKIENANYSELLIMQAQYQVQLEALERSFKAGLVTKQEYDSQSEVLKGTLDELNRVLGDNSKKTDENTEATKENTKATKDNTAAGIENAKAIVEQLSSIDEFRGSAVATREVMISLNKEYDYSSASVEQMTERLAQLDNQIQGADQKRERREINNAIRMRDWISQVESGSLSLQELGRIADLANNSVVRLSDNQLVPLNKAIDEARAKFQALTDEINQTTLDIQDRLDAALGNGTAIAERKFASELKEVESLIETAKSYGDSQLIAKLQKSLSDLKQAQDLERKTKQTQQEADKAAKAKSEAEAKQQTVAAAASTKAVTQTTTTTTTSSANAPVGNSADTIVLKLQVGGTTFDAQMKRSLVTELVAEIKRLQSIGG
ncbi:phage tail tape measure protein [Shewanella mangrovisoli]|uniref:phage tail tape measure protein n=1 Tax=Shewanella mangrovisoli TaxID=2864211 RepID=UPI001C654E67|nr:phage tail tape measure protein [Shewanella mangrovisoli]QYK07567.1 phage tail tape measure protein [Shewanella mangrovisoli]